jgi:hypothetical protein
MSLLFEVCASVVVLSIDYRKQQYKQCTYNVTLRRVGETIFALEKQ